MDQRLGIRHGIGHSKQERVCVCLRGACGVTRWKGESKESVYERCAMGLSANGVKCGVVEWAIKKKKTIMT